MKLLKLPGWPPAGSIAEDNSGKIGGLQGELCHRLPTLSSVSTRNLAVTLCSVDFFAPGPDSQRSSAVSRMVLLVWFGLKSSLPSSGLAISSRGLAFQRVFGCVGACPLWEEAPVDM